MSENKNSEYSISVDEFSRPPQELSEHRAGDSINRGNFLSLLVKSLALSMGDPGLQYVYFRWLGETTGFKWDDTLQNFMKAGGWDCLGDGEKTKRVNSRLVFEQFP